MLIVDGQNILSIVKKEVAKKVAHVQDTYGSKPHLAIIHIADEDDASKEQLKELTDLYHHVGFLYSVYYHTTNVNPQEVLDVITFLNMDEDVDGIIVNTPLPNHFNKANVLQSIIKGKDVLCLNEQPDAVEVLPLHRSLPYAMMELIDKLPIALNNKTCLFVEKKAGDTFALQQQLAAYTTVEAITLMENEACYAQMREADILFVAIDKPDFIRQEMIKQDVVLFDLGQHKMLSSGMATITGDVFLHSVKDKCKTYIGYETGIRPLLQASVLVNTLASNSRKLN